MEMISEVLWYSSLPLVVYISVKFVQVNIEHYKKMERLEELEEYYAKNEAAKK